MECAVCPPNDISWDRRNGALGSERGNHASALAMEMPDPARSPSIGMKLRAYYELTKPGVTLMVALSTVAGYALALPEGIFSVFTEGHGGRFLATLMGTLLTSGGSGALNHYAEWSSDQLMLRTRQRPIPAGVLTPYQGLLWGLVLCFLGLGVLLFVDFLVLLLATLTVVSYIVVYTPMKRQTPMALYVGAIPGAAPAAGGWIAASGLGWGAVLVFLVLYFWQLPHFLALSWLYRKDYAQAGFPMTAVLDQSGKRVAWQILLTSLILLGVTFAVGHVVQASLGFMGGIGLLGIWVLWEAFSFLRQLSFTSARRVLRSSYAYLLGFVAFAIGARL